jgi:RNA polymerase sigma factor (TIGR02999 family)
MPDRESLTHLLQRLDLSDPDQGDELLAVVYDELRAMAAKQLGREGRANTVRSTSLVHEAYLRMAASCPESWEGRSHFFGIFARAMRQVLVDHARRRDAEKRGGKLERLSLHSQILDDRSSEVDVLDLHRALEKLSEKAPSLGQLVELRFFGGLTMDEAAGVMGVSPRKAAKDWAATRLWLNRELCRT